MLTAKIMRQFRIGRDWSQAGYFETVRAKEISADVHAAIMAGRLVALSGPVGVGKTVMIKRLQQKITAEKKVIFARSLSIDKPRVLLPALMTALFLDISCDPNMKVPSQPERRERLLQEAIKDAKKPVVLFIDEAHDLHGNTLIGLKRLMETISAGFDDLDARLARIGYSAKSLAEQFDLTQAEARRFLKGKLDTDRTSELGDIMGHAGLPI